MDDLHETLLKIHVTLETQQALLKEHMRRTEAVERVVELVRAQMWTLAVGVLGALASAIVALVIHLK